MHSVRTTIIVYLYAELMYSVVSMLCVNLHSYYSVQVCVYIAAQNFFFLVDAYSHNYCIVANNFSGWFSQLLADL